MPPRKRRNPFHGVIDIVSEMNRMSDRMMGHDGGAPQQQRGHADAWSPTTDIVARGADLIIRSELPGVPAAEVEVTLSSGTLTIVGRRDPGSEADDDFLVRERYSGQFRRDITLPEGVCDQDIEARFEDGVLEVLVRGCAEAPGPAPIRIQSKSSG